MQPEEQNRACWHPSGVQSTLNRSIEGIASLNPRLIAGAPAGVWPMIQTVLLAVAAAGLTLAAGSPAWADEPQSDQSAAEAPRPAASGKDSSGDKGAAPDLQQILERLNRLERELVELRIKSGKIPEEKKDQRIITLIDTPYLGSTYYGSPTSVRFFAARLTVINLTDQPAVLKQDDISLSSEGQSYAVKAAPPQAQFHQFQVGQQTMQLRSLPLATEVSVPVGGTGSSWVLFPELPPGSHVPSLVIKLKLGETSREIDVNAIEREALGMKIERLGPRASLGMIRLSGVLNTVSVGSLVEELDRFAADRLVRAVIDWEDGSSISDQAILNWLQNSALGAGRGQPQFVEQQFPGLPASFREFHLAHLPNSATGPSPGYPSNFVPVTAAIAETRIHKTDAEAVVAALRSAYEVLPREEVLSAIQSGNRLERAAALAGGAGRLAADKLGLILKLADDDDAVIQQAALLALSHFGEPEAIAKLVECTRKNTAALSGTAVAALAGSRFAAAHNALLELLANETPESKKNIVRVLAAYPRPIWSEAIYEFVKDTRSGLNVEALGALVQVGHPKLLSVLAEALKGNDENLKAQAFNILAVRPDRESEELALDYTLERLKSGPPTSVMLQFLGRVKDRRALPLLMARFGGVQNKHELIQTLALIGDEETVKFLVEKYPNLQNHEKGEVLKLLARSDQASFRKLAVQALQSGDGALVNHAVQGLQEDSSSEAVRIMIDALEGSGQPFTWSYVANALAAVGTAPARAALLKARDSGNPEKRNFALNALQVLKARSPGYPYFQQAQQSANDSKWKEAIEQYGMAIQLDPNLSDAYAGRGHAWLHQEKFAEAAADFEKAYEQDPYNSLALTGICLVMVLADGKVDEAVKKLEGDREKFHNDGLFLYNAACVYGRALERVQKDEKGTEEDQRVEKYKQAALADLRKSIELGFQDFDLMKKDPDLKSLADVPEFQELLKSGPQNGARAGPRGNGPRGRRAAMRAR
jgi:tetratricopeptide (TPR) repeat protein